jgi:hypothetical protein
MPSVWWDNGLRKVLWGLRIFLGMEVRLLRGDCRPGDSGEPIRHQGKGEEGLRSPCFDRRTGRDRDDRIRCKRLSSISFVRNDENATSIPMTPRRYSGCGTSLLQNTHRVNRPIGQSLILRSLSKDFISSVAVSSEGKGLPLLLQKRILAQIALP